MKVFKFGGASVKDAAAVRNVAQILARFQGQKVVVVVSAMGKTTNKLEEIVDAIWHQNNQQFEELLQELHDFHWNIIRELFSENNFKLETALEDDFEEIKRWYSRPHTENYHYVYDQIVSMGEVLSTRIINAYLKEHGLKSTWMDARKLIRTNNVYREADIDWKKTEELLQQQVVPAFNPTDFAIFQGFIGHTPEGLTTTLGREGSDFTAAILAFCLSADSVTIWKDVPGMLNADPKYFDNTVKLDKISFYEAIELSYYGASVIHPKTVKPLQNKNIPLYVKSFLNPDAEGTVIQSNTESDHLVPSFIFKMDQVLYSITPKDFAFIAEHHLNDIFGTLSAIGAKINIMQNSALSFSFLMDRKRLDPQAVVDAFSTAYSIKYNDNLELVTIRHYDQSTIDRVMVGKELLLEQKTRQTVRMVVKEQGVK